MVRDRDFAGRRFWRDLLGRGNACLARTGKRPRLDSTTPRVIMLPYASLPVSRRRAEAPNILNAALDLAMVSQFEPDDGPSPPYESVAIGHSEKGPVRL